MALRSLISASARVELGLAALLVLLFATAISESEDFVALVLSSVILVAAPVGALVLNRSDAGYRSALAVILVACWPLILLWLLIYA